MRALDFIKAGIPQKLYINDLKDHFPLSFNEFKNRFNIQPGEFGFYWEPRFLEMSFELFEFHNIYPVVVPELYAGAVNWNVGISIHKDIVAKPEREHQRSHFASGTGTYGDNHEFPNMDHALNFTKILGYVCLERKLAILEKMRGELEEWYNDPTGREELRKQEMEEARKKWELENPEKVAERDRKRAEMKSTIEGNKGIRRRTPGDKKQSAPDFSEEE